MVPGAGIEPARPLSRGILSPLCLPISPPGRGRHLLSMTVSFVRINGGGGRNRTGVDGFAIRCIATLLLRQSAFYTAESGETHKKAVLNMANLGKTEALELLERERRLELPTPTLARSCSTTELFPQSRHAFYAFMCLCQEHFVCLKH